MDAVLGLGQYVVCGCLVIKAVDTCIIKYYVICSCGIGGDSHGVTGQ